MSCYSSLLTYFSSHRWAAAGLLALAVASCKNESEKVVPIDTNYYPLAVGDFRIYNVVDTTWTRNVKSYSRFQFRERVAEQYVDDTGRQNFRVIRSRRATAADSWVDDSVLVVSPAAGNVLVTRNNERRVELIFPVREGYWNANAFNNQNDIKEQNLRYIRVGEPFTTTSGTTTVTYPQTLTTTTPDEKEETTYINRFYYFRVQQVYALGEGIVYRNRRRFIYTEPGTSDIPSPNVIFRGTSRTEVLIEKGR
ncbi:hypothetical protein MTX78_11275 [Hymenobacter tibetensis]|uniref:DUF4249 domain-containing protein n=1 Tax=Hymenobacter tibetensis TaxID=497967 RepID=A0ABY4D7I9_9BACT|nr:hypothetical protein [Hymenobacter tibetensis]UOG77159.1 hypothetical protein MTX78_11275 [Hymenobacter tibetensis]